MAKAQALSAKMIGQIALMQSVVAQLPDKVSMLNFVCKGLQDVPGVDKVEYRLFEGEADAPAEKDPLCRRFLIVCKKRNYADLILHLSEDGAFLPYIPYVENFCGILALIFEERRQRKLNETLRENLEHRVHERTRELEKEVQERRQVATSLQESQKRLSMALRGANSGIWDWNVQTGEVYFDPNYFGLAGYEPDAFPHSYEEWKKRIHPEDLASAEERVASYLAGRTDAYVVEFRFRRADGEWMWIQSQGVVSDYDEEGKPLRFTGLHIDISRRKESEAKLSQANANLNATFDSIGEAVVTTGHDGAIARMNPVAERLVGWSSVEAQGRPLSQVFCAVQIDDEEDGSLARFFETEESAALPHPVQLQAREGEECLVAISGSPVRSETGEPLGRVWVFRDVTEESALQERLQQKQKMAAVGQLAGGIAHDFNNQLGGVMGYADLLEGRLSDPVLKRYAGNIVVCARRSADLTNQLLAFARKGQYQYTQVDLHKTIYEVVEILNHSIDRRIEIQQLLKASPSTTMGDPTQIQSALLNLALNARDAMPEGGVLTFATENAVLDDLYCASVPYDLFSGEYLSIEVTDTGGGIAPETQKRIFEPFFTTKEIGKGTGMGLAAVYGTIKQHKGAISVYSELNQGTTFRVYLPVARRESSPETDKQEPLVQGTARVLIVDDEPLLRELGADMLRDLGYKVVACNDGEEAVAYYRTAWNEVDLVLLDMVMPRMNGRDTFRAMKAINPNVRVILCSGFSMNDEARSIMKEGVLAFIGKPFRQLEVSQTIAQVLDIEV